LPHAFDQAKKKAIRKLALFEVERAAITNEFEKAGIWYMPLKGILLKDYYPKFAMREMTDNDILVDSSRMEDVKEIMERLGYNCTSFGERNHDVYSKPPTLEFEMHSALFPSDIVPQLAEYFKNFEKKATRSGLVLKLSDEDFYLYILCHAYNHYNYAGLGLRSLLDVYVFLRSHTGLDRNYLTEEFEKLKITAFEEKMRRLSNKMFTGAELNVQEQKELDYFISSGCNGTVENYENNQMAKYLGNDDSKDSKRRYLKRRVFLSGEHLENNYPFFARHKALYPFLLVYRPVKGLITRPKEIMAEYKFVKRFKKREEQ
jgi:hypothetical protein